MLRSSTVPGSFPIAAIAVAQYVEKARGLKYVPDSNKPDDLPLLTMTCVQDTAKLFIIGQKRVSFIDQERWARDLDSPKHRRGGDIGSGEGLGHGVRITRSSVVFRNAFSGDFIARRGETDEASSACACMIHNATATAPSQGSTTNRVMAEASSFSSSTPSTVSGQGSGKDSASERPARGSVSRSVRSFSTSASRVLTRIPSSFATCSRLRWCSTGGSPASSREPSVLRRAR